MRRVVLAGLLVSVTLVAQVFGAVKERKIQLRWEELSGVVLGKKVEMVLRNGEEVKGRVRAVEPQALQIDVSSGSSSYEKGLRSIPRSQVSVLRFEERSGTWRALGTAIGAGGGAAVGIPAYTYFNNEADPGTGAGIAAGAIAGGAVAGYLIGRSADRQAVVVSIIEP